MNIAVLGYGSIGARHVRHIRSLGHAVDAFDPAVSTLPDAPASLSDYDAVVIASPYRHHLADVERVVRAHIPFYLEKPIGDVSELGAWQDLAKHTLPVHQVGYQCRFASIARKFAQSAADICDLVCETDMRGWPGSTYGHPVLECSHEIDLALWWGVGGLVSVDWEPHGVRMLFQRGRVRLGWRHPIKRQWAVSPIGRVQFDLGHPLPVDGWYREAMAHFLARVRKPSRAAAPAAQLRDGVRVLEVCAWALNQQHDTTCDHPSAAWI